LLSPLSKFANIILTFANVNVIIDIAKWKFIHITINSIKDNRIKIVG